MILPVNNDLSLHPYVIRTTMGMILSFCIITGVGKHVSSYGSLLMFVKIIFYFMFSDYLINIGLIWLINWCVSLIIKRKISINQVNLRYFLCYKSTEFLTTVLVILLWWFTLSKSVLFILTQFSIDKCIHWWSYHLTEGMLDDNKLISLKYLYLG